MAEVIEISPYNLFITGRLIEFPADGEGMLVRDKVTFTGDTLDRWHPVIQNDMLWLLAWEYYKDETPDAAKYYWAIADANNIHNPFDLSEYVGKDILIPDFKKIQLKV